MSTLLFTLVDARGFSHKFTNHAFLYESPMMRRFLSFKYEGAEPDNKTHRTLALDPKHTKHMPGTDEVLEIMSQMDTRPQLKYPWHVDRTGWTDDMMSEIDLEATSWDDLFERQEREMKRDLVRKIEIFSPQTVMEMAIVCSPKWLDIPILMKACMQRSYDICSDAPMGVSLTSLDAFAAFRPLLPVSPREARPRPEGTEEAPEPKRAI